MHKTVKVRALWNMGYDGKDRPAGSEFWCDPEWAERKSEKNRVEILEERAPVKQKTEQKKTKPDSGHSDKEGALLKVNVKEAADIINDTSSVVLLNLWLEEEKANENRKTVLEAIKVRLSELAEDGE